MEGNSFKKVEVSKPNTKKWHKAVIDCSQYLINIYKENRDKNQHPDGSYSDMREDCPFCEITAMSCSLCPWVIYNARLKKGAYSGYMCLGYESSSFRNRIKRLNRWIKRSKEGLVRMSN